MATERDEVTLPIFTINHFPGEIVERFAPDLRPRTVSTLRLVSRRFRDVFSADHYYRCYLRYPYTSEIYRSDLEEIGDVEGKWWSLLKMEKLRCDNWRNGRFTRVDTVELPDFTVPTAPSHFYWQGKSGEENELWMMCESRPNKIVLVNATRAPLMTVIDVSAFTSCQRDFAVLLPEQVLICDDTDASVVFNIVNDGKKLSLDYFFTLETDHEWGVSLSGKSQVTNTFRSLYVTCSRDYTTNTALGVWDLKRGVRLENVDLKLLLKPFCDFDKVNSCSVRIYEAEFPYVLVRINLPIAYAMRHMEAVLNVDERKIACFFNWGGNVQLALWTFKGNFVVFCFEHFQGEPFLRVYDLLTPPKPKGHLFQCEWPGASVLLDPPLLIYLGKPYGRRVEYKCFNGTDCSKKDFIVDGVTLSDIHYAVGPFLLASGRTGSDDDNDESSVFTLEMSSKVLFDWGEMLSKRIGNVDSSLGIRHNLGMNFQSLSRCTLQNKRGDKLYFCYF